MSVRKKEFYAEDFAFSLKTAGVTLFFELNFANRLKLFYSKLNFTNERKKMYFYFLRFDFVKATNAKTAIAKIMPNPVKKAFVKLNILDATRG